nr:hypothetical protein BaRGS_022322 [Batillaria attramentaria]
MYGGDMGTLEVFVAPGGASANRIKVWGLSGNQGNMWKEASLTIDTPDAIKVIFKGTYGTGYRGDIAVDDVSETEGGCPGHFMYIEATPLASRSVAVISSPAITSGDPTSCLTFWYHMQGSMIGTLSVYTTSSTGQTRDCVLRQQSTGTTGEYMYIETTSPRASGDVARLLSPVQTTSSHENCLTFCSACRCTNLPYYNSGTLRTDNSCDPMRSGETPSPDTGPENDHTLGVSGGGHYMYLETSNGNPGDTADLITADFTESANLICLTFYYLMYGDDVGKLEVFSALANDVTVTQKEFEKTGDQGRAWKKAELTLAIGPPIKVRLSGANYSSTNHSSANHPSTNHSSANHSSANHSSANHSSTNHSSTTTTHNAISRNNSNSRLRGNNPRARNNYPSSGRNSSASRPDNPTTRGYNSETFTARHGDYAAKYPAQYNQTKASAK